LATGWVAIAGCQRAPVDATPEGAVDRFLEAIESAPVDPQAPQRAYQLLAQPSKAALQSRATRASAILGKTVTPESLLLPSFTPIRWPVERTTTTIAPDGRATVDLFGADPQVEHTVVALVREGALYRIDLGLERLDAAPQK